MLETDETLRAKLGSGSRAAAVRCSGKIAAVMKFRPLDGADLVIARLGVLPEHRGRGLAKMLLHWLEDQARREGADGIAVVVPSSDASLIELFGHLGLDLADRGKQLTLSGELLDVSYLRRAI